MSLLRLLTTGKTLVGMREGNSPYRMCTKNMLPNFGSSRNPFLPEPKAAPTPAPVPVMPASTETPSLFDVELKPVERVVKKGENPFSATPEPLPRQLETPLSSLPAVPEAKVSETVATPNEPAAVVFLGSAKTSPLAHGIAEKGVTSCVRGLQGSVGFAEIEPMPFPARLTTVAPVVEELEPETEVSVTAEEKSVALEMPVASASVERKVEKFVPAQPKPVRKTAARKPVKASGFSRWLVKMNSMLRISAWGKVGATRLKGGPVRPRPPEQAEFLLAQVKPLRNELNDSDLRVVTTTVNAPVTKPVEQAGKNVLNSVAAPWNRLTKIFGADHHVEAR